MSFFMGDAVVQIGIALLLERFGLGARAPVPAGFLSHGEKRQLELATALATGPKLLLLDEPLSALDRTASQPPRRSDPSAKACGTDCSAPGGSPAEVRYTSGGTVTAGRPRVSTPAQGRRR